MIYAIELDLKAMGALFALVQHEAEFVSFNLFKLAESPRDLSMISTVPRRMEYIFRLAEATGDSAIWFSVIWQYKREEIV